MVDKPAFKMGDHVEKISGSSWRGRVVGTYSTDLTREGYAVESDTEKGSVQIYPAKALRLATPANGEQVERVKVLEEALRAIQRIAPRDVHDGYDYAGNYIWEEFIRLSDVNEIARTALGNKETDRHG